MYISTDVISMYIYDMTLSLADTWGIKHIYIYTKMIAKAHATLGKLDTQLGNFQDVGVCLAHSLSFGKT